MDRAGGRQISGAVVLGCTLLYVLAIASFDIRDIPERAWPVNARTRNLLGPEGARLAFAAFDWLGLLGAWSLALAGAWLGASWLRGRRGGERPQTPAAFAALRPFGLFVLVVAFATLESLLVRDGLLPGLRREGLNPGGYWGAFCAAHLPPHPVRLLSYCLALVGAGIGGLLALEDEARGGTPSGRAGRSDPPEGGQAAARPEPAALSEPVGAPPQEASLAQPAAAGASEGDGEGAPAVLLTLHLDDGAEPHATVQTEEPEPEVDPEGPEPEAQPAPARRPKRRSRSRGGGHRLPPPDLLESPVRSGSGAHEAELRRQAEVLGRTLADFRVDARVVSVERGPNITTFELELAAGVKINRIASLEQDLALALGVQSVRLVGPTKGRSTLGIEAPNPEQEVVRLAELIDSREYSSKQRALPLLLGKDARGAPLIADLARMPHLLIAGATGSGKSVCTNAIIVSMLLTRTPREVRMILIDPKMVELALYDRIPHLLAPVVTDMRQAPAILEWAVEKMEQRYKLLSRAAVRHIRSYNALGKRALAERLGLPPEELEQRAIPWEMPYIVVVIDEFADLMCVARKEVETSVVRLAQKSRAVGIHLILATQRPTADVITGLIKSNMPCRIAFQVASKLDSRTIIDRNGAETLVGQGDMLYLPPGTSRLVRAQGAFVSDDEVKAVVDWVKGQAEPDYDAELMQAGRGGEQTEAPSDPLFEQAVRIVLETGRGSASLLQRQLEIGYSRASRLIDHMTEQGILGPFKGSKAREILMTLEQWEQMRAAGAEG